MVILPQPNKGIPASWAFGRRIFGDAGVVGLDTAIDDAKIRQYQSSIEVGSGTAKFEKVLCKAVRSGKILPWKNY